MDQRIIHYYEGGLTADEKRQLLREAFENPSLKQEMMDYQHVHALMSLYPEVSDEGAGRRSWRLFAQSRRRERRWKVAGRLLRYAAVLAVGVVSTWWVSLHWQPTEQPVTVAQQLTVPAGQRAHLVLPDGSKVWVNAGSVLQYPSVFGAERRVRVTGEAFFEVAKDKAPFIVSTGKMDVRALGTRFNVYNYPSDRMSVSLLEGAVKVYPPQREDHGIVLAPGQQVSEEEGRWVISSIVSDPVSWKEGIYAFHHQTLGYILHKLEMYYDVKFIVKRPSLLQYEYTGKFRQRDGVMEVLRIIQKIHPFRISRPEDSNEITLY